MRRTSRSTSKKGRVPENLQDLAAWLYTDLLLGLAVAFVGAGAFMVANPNYKGKTSVVLTYQLSCDALEIAASQSISEGELQQRLRGAITARADSKGWTEVKPGVINLFGGGSNPSIGTANAKKFRDRVVSGTPVLANTEILPYADSSLSPSQVKLRVYLVYKGAEIDNGCK
jgi:hypothetical protein